MPGTAKIKSFIAAIAWAILARVEPNAAIFKMRKQLTNPNQTGTAALDVGEMIDILKVARDELLNPTEKDKPDNLLIFGAVSMVAAGLEAKK